jgi:O-antigen ligase
VIWIFGKMQHKSFFKLSTTFLIVLPWINPLAIGPAPGVWPWLVSMVCMIALLLYFASINMGDLRSWPYRLSAVVASAWVLAACLSACMGLLQYFGWASGLVPWLSSAPLGEAFANLRQRNQFASLTNIGLLAVLWWAAHVNRLKSVAVGSTGLALITVLLAFANVASSSRTGLVQLGLILTMTWWWSHESRNSSARLAHRLLLTAVSSYLLAVLVLPVLAGSPLRGGAIARLQDRGDACSSRIVLWSNVLEMIAQKPWLGWGWGELRYAHFMTLYDGPRFCEIMGNAHNLPLHLAVTMGLPLATLLFGSGVWLVWGAKPWQETDPTRQLAWGVLALIGLHSLLEYPLWYGPFQMAMGLCLAMLWLTRSSRHGDVAQTCGPEVLPMPSKTKAIFAWMAMPLITLIAYAGWDYHQTSQVYLSTAQRSAVYKDHTFDKIRSSWLFRNEVQFAVLAITPLSQDNAAQLNASARELLHYSPEARVVEKLINSARLLGREDEAQFFALRYQRAYPEAYAHMLGTGSLSQQK